VTLLFDPSLYSGISLIGLAWTLLTLFLMFSPTGRRLLSNPLGIVMAAAALFPSLWLVTSQIKVLTALAGGIPPLDVQFGYHQTEIAQFAQALTEGGRKMYAQFQLGADTLAPPGFCCFLMSVYRSTVRSSIVRSLCDGMAFVYLASVLIANTMMPVIILNYPSQDGVVLSTLYWLVPICDTVKYSVHGLAWLIIVTAWLGQLVAILMARKSSRPFSPGAFHD
jgi:hypothetical protein